MKTPLKMWLQRLVSNLSGNKRNKPLANVLAATSLDAVPFVVLDLETTGFDRQHDEILAIGAIHMRGSRILVGHTFEQLVQPRQSTWHPSVPVHRILPVDVASAPPLESVLPQIAAFCSGAVLVGHTVTFDRDFLGSPLSQQPWLDIQLVAKWLARQPSPPEAVPPSTSLAGLARHYNISTPKRHHALIDAFVTAQIWQRQIIALQVYGKHILADIAKIALV